MPAHLLDDGFETGLLALGREEEAREAHAEAGRRLTERGAAPGLLAWHCSATARLQQSAGDLEGARETWRECLDAHPADPAVVAGAMSIHDSQGELDRSLEIVRAALEQYPGVAVAHLSGHYHAGGYWQHGGVHYLTFHGMVETMEDNAFAVLRLYPDRIEVDGYGHQPSYTLHPVGAASRR